MNIEELQARIVELENSLQAEKDINTGLLEKQKGFENTIREKDNRISTLIDRNTDMFLKISQPIPDVEPIKEEPKGPSQEETISLDDILN